MVKISTLASAVDTPAAEALSPRSLSFRDKQLEPFASFTSESISPQDTATMAGTLRLFQQNKMSTNPKILKEERSLELLERRNHTPPPEEQEEDAIHITIPALRRSI